MNKGFISQIIKYGIIGIMNTLLTAVVIWVMMRWFFGVKEDNDASSVAMSVSNFVGYTVGLINSFIFNRNWTFKSKSSWKIGFLKFVLAFGICYIIQLGIVLCLNEYANIPTVNFNLINKNYIINSAYICQLIGIVSYTLLNFFFNKYYTFRK